MPSSRQSQVMRSRIVTACLVTLSLCLAAPAHGQSPVATPRPVAGANEASGESADYIDVTIPAIDGKVQWSEVAKAVAESITLDEESVARLLPKGELLSLIHI